MAGLLKGCLLSQVWNSVGCEKLWDRAVQEQLSQGDRRFQLGHGTSSHSAALPQGHADEEVSTDQG